MPRDALRPASTWAAKIVVAMLFGLLAALILFAYATVVGGVRLAPGLWASVIGRLWPVAAADRAGIRHGFVAGPNARPRSSTSSTCRCLSPPASPAARPAAGLRAARGAVLPTYHYAAGWPGAPSAPVASR